MMAAAVVANERQGPFPGIGRYYACLATLDATETTAVTINTGLQTILNVQVSWATSIGTTTSSLFTTVSGGTVTLDATDAVTGTNKAYVIAYGT